MRFLVDAQLPPALARVLASHGHEASHVYDLGMHKATDTDIWQLALDQDAVLVTKDEDFAHRLRQGTRGPIIVWLRVGNTSRKGLLHWFEPLLPRILSLVDQGERLIEVR